MKKTVLFILLIDCLLLSASEAKYEDIQLDLMETPTSPAITILGISPTLVETQNQPKLVRFFTNDDVQKLAGIPKNYAFETAPFWFLYGDTWTFDDYKKCFGNPLQYLAFSLATTRSSDVSGISDSRYLGMGINIAILRGDLDPESQKEIDSLILTLKKLHINNNNKIRNYQRSDRLYVVFSRIEDAIFDVNIANALKLVDEARNIINIDGSVIDKDSYNARLDDVVANLESDSTIHISEEAINDLLAKRLKVIADIVNNDVDNEIKNAKDKSDIKINKIGWKANISGASALEYSIDEAGKLVGYSGNNRKWSSWGTVEYKFPKSIFNFLACGRYIGYPHENEKSSTDAGARVILNQYDEGLAYSIEYLRRLKPEQDWRLAAVFDFCFAKNTVASVSLGRDFGNSLASTLNFSIGLGSKRNITMIQ